MTEATHLPADRVLGEDLSARGHFGRGRPGDHERIQAAVRREAAAWSRADRSLLECWQRLAALGRSDLVYGRLVEGHADAVTILGQAGRKPVEDAVYAVWASGSAGTGLRVEPSADGHRLSGRLRYCTGATWVDRALVTARSTSTDETDGAVLLFDLPVTPGQWKAQDGTWQAVGMDLSDSMDVEVDVGARPADQVGPAGFYIDRPGFPLGGIGVAAVWLGGAAGVLDAVQDALRRFEPDPHQLAHLGAMTIAVQQADALLVRAALDGPRLEPPALAATALACRGAVDACVQEVLVRAPRLTGPTPLCRDGDFAHRLADLSVYVRQQHAERDLAALGRQVLAGVSV